VNFKRFGEILFSKCPSQSQLVCLHHFTDSSYRYSFTHTTSKRKKNKFANELAAKLDNWPKLMTFIVMAKVVYVICLKVGK